MQMMLHGCSGGVDGDTVEFVQEIKNRKSKVLEPTPALPQAQSFKYKAADFRDPFETFVVAATESEPKSDNQVVGPDLHRVREALESFPLDSLQMVGTLERAGEFFVLLRDNVGTVHTVTIGNYVGQNAGKIGKITETAIEITEWLPSGKGGLKEHMTVLPLMKKGEETSPGK